MCGILGFNWNDRELGLRLGKLIAHRGPDGEGCYSDNNFTLSHRRLAIIDLSDNASQPMFNENETIVIVYNGEIFNYRELKKELIDKGHIFKSNSDTEVIIHGYEEWGYSVLDRLDGQFAFSIYDRRNKKIFLARDRMGINPLYYYYKDGKFAFSSELKVLMKLFPVDINVDAAYKMILFGYIPGKESIMRHSYRVDPGSYLVFDIVKGSITAKKYWMVDFSEEFADESVAERLTKLIRKSVHRRLLSDVPVGAYLSGGLDSSLVVAFMSEKFRDNEKLNTFSIKFDKQGYDESKYAEIVAKKFRTRHHVIEFSAKDILSLVKKLRYHFDEPFGDMSMVPTFLVANVASRHVTVSLSGDGGDELFGGYKLYRYYSILQKQKYLPKWIGNMFGKVSGKISDKMGMVSGKIDKVSGKIEKAGRLSKAFFEISRLPKDIQYARLSSYFEADDFYRLTGKKLDDEILEGKSSGGKSILEYFRGFESKDNYSFLNHAIATDFLHYLPENILFKVDRASLGNSIESRPPLLSHEIVEFSAKIHPRLKLKRGEGKYILKKVAENFLPKKIVYRKKKGFSVPLKYYFKDELNSYAKEKVLMNKHGLFNDDFLKSIINMIDIKDVSRIVWSIIMFNEWWDEWME